MNSSAKVIGEGIKVSDGFTSIQASLFLLLGIFVVCTLIYFLRNGNIPGDDDRESFVYSIAKIFVGFKTIYLGFVVPTVAELRVYAIFAGILFTLSGLNKTQKIINS